MDALLPPDDVMDRLALEYAAAFSRRGKGVSPLCSAVGRSGVCASAAPAPAPVLFLLLYFAFALGYNAGYGNAASDAYGNLGGVQPRQGRDGNLDFFFLPKR